MRPWQACGGKRWRRAEVPVTRAAMEKTRSSAAVRNNGSACRRYGAQAVGGSRLIQTASVAYKTQAVAGR